MVCICIFPDYLEEEHLNNYLVLSNETMFLSGTGFKSIILKRYQLKAKRLMNLSLMRHCLKLDQNMSGFGSQLSQKISKFSHYQYQKRETCLLLKDLFQN